MSSHTGTLQGWYHEQSHMNITGLVSLAVIHEHYRTGIMSSHT